jgi:hypothetical protein
VQANFQCGLKLPDQLSPGFKQFYGEFQSYLDYIIRWDYEILPQLQNENVSKTELNKLKQRYDELLVESRRMCRRFVGPHSVL